MITAAQRPSDKRVVRTSAPRRRLSSGVELLEQFLDQHPVGEKCAKLDCPRNAIYAAHAAAARPAAPPRRRSAVRLLSGWMHLLGANRALHPRQADRRAETAPGYTNAVSTSMT